MDPIIPMQEDVILLPLSACGVASSPWFPLHGIQHRSFCVSPTACSRGISQLLLSLPQAHSPLSPFLSSTSTQPLRESFSPLFLSAYHSSHSVLVLSCKTVRNEPSDKTATAKAWRLQTPWLYFKAINYTFSNGLSRSLNSENTGKNVQKAAPLPFPPARDLNHNHVTCMLGRGHLCQVFLALPQLWL